MRRAVRDSHDPGPAACEPSGRGHLTPTPGRVPAFPPPPPPPPAPPPAAPPPPGGAPTPLSHPCRAGVCTAPTNIATPLSRLAVPVLAWPVPARLPRRHPQALLRLRRRHGRHAGAVRPHLRGLRRASGQVPRGADPPPPRRHRGRPPLDGGGGRGGRRDRHVPGQ